MIQVKKGGVLLQKTENSFENHSVLNPGILQLGNILHVFYRAVDQNNHSTIGYCRFKGPFQLIERHQKPILSTTFIDESHGLEDPRICRIDHDYYLTYTAFDGVNALGALALSADLKHFHKKGVIVPRLTYKEFGRLAGEALKRYSPYFSSESKGNFVNPDNLIWDKNLIFFPRRIHGKLVFMHRIKPDIQLVSVRELEELTPLFWERYISNLERFTVLRPKYGHEQSYIGGGAPPIETDSGWLLIYHGVKQTPEGNCYSVCAALLDLNDPLKELARLSYPLFEPEFIWERKGEVNNVCFPSGTAIFEDTLYIYYGAADQQIAYASVCFSALISALTQNIMNHETTF